MRTWVLERFQVYGRVCLIAVVFVTPLVFHGRNSDPFSLVKLATMWVLGVTALALWVAWSFERGVWFPALRLVVPTGIFLGVNVLATVLSVSPAVSLMGLETRYGGVIPLALYIVIMLMIVAFYWERPGDLKELVRASAVASLVMSSYVWIQKAGLDWLDWQEATGGSPLNPIGTMGNSNFTGGYLGIAVPLVAYLAIAAKRDVWKVALSVLVMVDLAAIWFTQSRGGMLAAVVGLFVMGFMYLDRLGRFLRTLFVSAFGFVVVLAILVIWHPGFKAPPWPVSELDVFRRATLEYRLRYWKTAWEIFLDNPVLGTGPDTYVINYPKYRLPSDARDYGFVIADKPHNIYLENAVNTGILGLGSYISIFGMAIWFASRRRKKLEASERLLLTGFVGMLSGYAAQGFFSIDIPALAILGWVALGGIATLADSGPRAALEKRKAGILEAENQLKKPGTRKRKLQPEETQPKLVFATREGRLLWPLYGAVAAVLSVLLFIGLNPVRAGLKMTTIQVLEQSPEPQLEEVDIQYRETVALAPTMTAYRAFWGSFIEKRALVAETPQGKKLFLKRALAQHRKTLSLRPNNVNYMINVARVYEIWGQYVEPERYADADRWWERALSVDPQNWELYKEFAVYLANRAEAGGDNADLQRRRIQLLEVATRARPDIADTWVMLGNAFLAAGERDKARASLQSALRADPGHEGAKTILTTTLSAV